MRVRNMELPKKVRIIDQTYTIEYVGTPSEVDVFKRRTMWGHIDYWTRSIRVYAPEGHAISDIWNTLWHEIIHGIIHGLQINEISGLDDEEEEHVVHLLATGINAVIHDNKFIE